MKAIGIDIGTTTVCGIVIDAENGKVLNVETLANDSLIEGETYEWIQNPERIWELVQKLYQEFTGTYQDICSVGLTGQMHGIVYTDEDGQSVSPLYTWQDESGNELSEDGKTFVAHFIEETGYFIASGYGMATYYYHMKKGLIPEKASCICTIYDYIGMKLTGRNAPLLTPSSAASLGCFNLKEIVFEKRALLEAGIRADILPDIENGYVVLGKTKEGIPVGAGIGDNQASVLGSVKNARSSVLINVGTGSQVSVGVDHYVKAEHVELRPLINGDYILVGSGLCGGRAYAALENFFRRTVTELTGIDPGAMYGKMAEMLEKGNANNYDLKINTRFCGTRENPNLTGGISNLRLDNFTPEALIEGVQRGIAEELVTFYRSMRQQGAGKPLCLVGSGNGIRKNPHLRKTFESIFGMKMQIPVHKEEAAYGAALYAMAAAGIYENIEDAQQLICYL